MIYPSNTVPDWSEQVYAHRECSSVQPLAPLDGLTQSTYVPWSELIMFPYRKLLQEGAHLRCDAILCRGVGHTWIMAILCAIICPGSSVNWWWGRGIQFVCYLTIVDLGSGGKVWTSRVIDKHNLQFWNWSALIITSHALDSICIMNAFPSGKCSLAILAAGAYAGLQLQQHANCNTKFTCKCKDEERYSMLLNQLSNLVLFCPRINTLTVCEQHNGCGGMPVWRCGGDWYRDSVTEWHV